MNEKLKGNEILNVLYEALSQVMHNEDGSQELQSGENYINRTAAALLVKFNETSVDSLRYSNGSPVEKAYLDDIAAMLGNFNRSDYVTGTRAQVLLDAVYNNNEFFKNFTIKYGNELTIPIDLKAYAKRQLMSTERLGRQLTAGEHSALASISGFEMYCLPIELQYDIKMTEIRNNLYNPNFEKEVLIQPMVNVLSEDLLDLATNGISDSYSAVSGGFTYLGIGHEYLLQNLNGSWTNTNGTSIVTGKFGKYHTPNRIKLPFSASSYTGFDLITTMDKMYKMLPAQFRDRKDLAWVMAQADADLYRDAKGAAVNTVGINTVDRDKIVNNGILVPHQGIPVKVNPKKASVGDGGNFYLGCLKELYVGTQKMVNTTREYKARMSSGGDGIENTKHMNVDFQVGLRNAFVICAPSMKTEPVTMIKSIVGGATVYTDREYNKGDVYTSATTDQSVVSGVTVYCDTPNARIFVSIGTTTSFDDGTLLPTDSLATTSADTYEVQHGDLLTIATGKNATLRAYTVLNGAIVETVSDLKYIRYTAA